VFHVRGVDSKVTRLVIADPQDVVTGPMPGTPLNFACGPQSQKVLIGHNATSSGGTAGRVRYIEFP
jgi:hypothetical protein